MLPQPHRHRIAGNEVVVDLALHAGHPVFFGHFPGHPVLAGAVQIDWAMGFAGEYLGLGQRAAQEFQVKFRRVIVPATALSLTLLLDRPRGTLSFDYRVDTTLASSGRIRLEPHA